MANEEHLKILRQGVEAWNAWREKNPIIHLDLAGADLRRADLGGARLGRADLHEADFREADLGEADLHEADLGEAVLARAVLARADLIRADLHGANLRGAHLDRALLTRADLTRADLHGANLDGTNFGGADFTMANLTRAKLAETALADLDLSSCKGLDSCEHLGPSIIDHRTLQRSGPLPLSFLRGVGLPEPLIDYLPSLLNQAIQFYSCFISYSSKDHTFVERLHADLQGKGVRCWFAPKDLKIGDGLAETIDAAIRVRDKLLLVLSETSMASAWVLKEVRTALAEEERNGRTVLFPVRVDDAVMDTTELWAHDIRRVRHIGNFTNWKEPDAYLEALERLLRDLKVEAS